MSFKVCVCGGRDFNNQFEIFRLLNKLHKIKPITEIVHGAAKGADAISGLWASQNNVNEKKFEANWDLYNKRAGLIRNEEMAKYKPDLVIAFPGGNGTNHMISMAKKYDIQLYIVKLLYTIEFKKTGSIFDSNCDYITNPVNSIGVMGAGLAKQFITNPLYKSQCETYNKKVKLGTYNLNSIGLVEPILFSPINKAKGILFFPTKVHYKNPSSLPMISYSLKKSVDLLTEYNVRSLALPKIGCGLGGLDWTDVEQLIYKYFSTYKGHIEIY